MEDRVTVPPLLKNREMEKLNNFLAFIILWSALVGIMGILMMIWNYEPIALKITLTALLFFIISVWFYEPTLGKTNKKHKTFNERIEKKLQDKTNQ